MLSVNNRAQKVTRRKKIKENYKNPSKDFNAMLSWCGTTNLEYFPFFKSLGECSLALCNGPLKNIQQQLFFVSGDRGHGTGFKCVYTVYVQFDRKKIHIDVDTMQDESNCERCLWKAPLSSDGSTVNVRL